jgi:hypothetical protein
VTRIYDEREARWMLYHDFYLGLDLGKAADHSAVSIVEEPVWLDGEWSTAVTAGVAPGEVPLHGWVSVDRLNIHELAEARRINLTVTGRPANPPLRVRHLKRYPLQIPYQAIVEEVVGMLRSGKLAGADVAVLIDKGNAGTAVQEMFAHIGVRVIPVLIHGGYQTAYDRSDGTYRVPKRDLVEAAQVALQNRRLEISASLPDAGILVEELRNFRGTVSEAGRDRYEAREREHDDLVLSLSMGVWFREYRCRHIESQMARRSPRGGARRVAAM